MKIKFTVATSAPTDLDAGVDKDSGGWDPERRPGARGRSSTWTTRVTVRYTRLDYRSGVETWEYSGPLRVFLAQDLLPRALVNLREREILSVKGIRGSFRGPDALEKYNAADKASIAWIKGGTTPA